MSRRFWPLVAIAGGVVLGAGDLLLQRTLPYPWANLANSSAVWAVAAFGFGRWLRAGWWRSALGAALLLVVAVEAYYLAATLAMGDDLRNLWSPATVFWLAGGVGAGLLFGAAGDLSVQGRGLLRPVAAALPAAVLLAEAVLLADRARRAADAGYRVDSLRTAVIEAVLGLLVLVIFGRGVRGTAAAAAVALTALGFAAFRLAGFGA